MQCTSTPVLAGQERAASHLVPLQDPRWAFWRCAGLRGAGFPVNMLEGLASANATASADAVVELENRQRQIRHTAIQQLEQRLALGVDAESPALEHARRRLQRGKETAPTGLGGAIDDAIERFRRINEEVEAAQAYFQQQHQRDRESFSLAIRQLARDPRFLEAILWQNRRVLETAIKPLLDTRNEARYSRQRPYEEMLANYLQRYCAKNDTIGFFGPMGWAQFTEEGDAVVAVPGKELIATREVYFEHWAIETIAHMIENWDGTKRWLPPRPDPCIAMRGEQLYLADGRILRLDADVTQVLAHCDGIRTAEEIADDLIFESMEVFSSQDQVFAILEELEQDRMIGWGIQLPGGPQAVAALRKAIARLGDDDLRKKAGSCLARLECGRQDVAAAAGDTAKLGAAFSELEAAFTEITGSRANRRAGLTYAGRALVYEDCRRDLDLKLGPEIIQAIGGPLSLFLASSNFLVREVAAIFQQKCNAIYNSLVAETGEQEVRGNQFWQRLEPELLSLPPCVDSVLQEFQRKWFELLRFSPESRLETYTTAQLEPEVRKIFGKSEAVWPASIYSSPDIMIAADDVESINQGRYLAVLGEVHISGNTLGSTLFVAQHPNPAELVQAREQDIHPPAIFLLPPQHLPKLTTRTHIGLVSQDDLGLDFSLNSTPVEGLRRILIGDISISREGSDLIARVRAPQPRLRVLDVFECFLAALVQPAFRPLPPMRHTPRLVCGRLVFARESWHFEPEDFAFAFQKDEPARFLAARRWVAANGVPRFVFVKIPNETKPFFVDFTSVTCMNLLAKNVRKCHETSPRVPVRITEMLPTPDQCWLADREGRRYTSEIRMVSVDRWLADAHHARTAKAEEGLKL